MPHLQSSSLPVVHTCGWGHRAAKHHRTEERERKCDLLESQSYDFMNIFAIGFSISCLFPKPPWSLMDSVGGNYLAFSTKGSDTWAERWMEGDSTLSVMASLHGLSLLSLPPAWAGLHLRAVKGASKRRCDVSKCQTASCCCQLLWAMIFIRGKQLSAPEPGISLRAQADGGKMHTSKVSCSTHWAGTWH